MDWRTQGIAVAAGAGLLVWLANRSVFFPMRYPEGFWQEQSWAGAEDAWIKPGLHGWWRREPESRCVALFLHGNAGNVTHRAPAIREIAAAGASVLVLDYRGYGKSKGWPTESGLYADASAAYRWLLERGWKPNQILLHGESLGCAVAVELASRVESAGLILEAPFPSARAVAARVLPVLGPLLVWGFDSTARIGRVRVPIFVIHGDRDEVIDYQLGRELFDAAREPKRHWTVPGAHHNDIHEVAGIAYREKLREFMISACNAAASSSSH